MKLLSQELFLEVNNYFRMIQIKRIFSNTYMITEKKVWIIVLNNQLIF